MRRGWPVVMGLWLIVLIVLAAAATGLSCSGCESKKSKNEVSASSGQAILKPNQGGATGPGPDDQGRVPRCPAGMVGVPAGTFWMGCNEKADRECGDDEKLSRVRIENAYCIDESEVTVRAYRRCVDAGRCKEPGAEYCNWGKPGRERHPVNCVSWQDSRDYCSWANKRLPSEKEWEKAARGTDGRKYPWGNAAPTCERAVFNDRIGGKENEGCSKERTWPVCSKRAGNSPYRACDMAGNVWEWTADRNRPAGWLRGGSWLSEAWWLRASYRFDRLISFQNDVAIGFRCASHQ